jgi:glycosyltransferase involved in cell wall biosynthesis
MGTLAEAADAPAPAAGARPTVLVLTEDSKPARGGIAEGLHQLSLALAATHDVRIVSSIEGAGTVDAGPGVRYEEVPWFRAQTWMPGDAIPLVRRANTLRWYATRRGRVRRRLEEIGAAGAPDWLLVYRLSNVTWPWCVAARELGLAYDVFVHGLELIEPAAPWTRRARRRALRLAGRVFANSGATATLARDEGVAADRLTVVRHGVFPDRLVVRDERSRATVRALTEGRRFLLSVCTLVERKGMDLAIRSLADLGAEHSDLLHVAVGVGPEEARLRELARSLGVAGRVRFAGEVSDDVKFALYEACELFVLPNRRLPNDVEGFGIVFLEANHFGKAVVGGDNGGVPDAVADGESGLLVDTSVGHAPLTAALRRLLGDPALARRLGEQGRARVERELTWDRVAAGMLERRTPAAPASVVRRGGRRHEGP